MLFSNNVKIVPQSNYREPSESGNGKNCISRKDIIQGEMEKIQDKKLNIANYVVTELQIILPSKSSTVEDLTFLFRNQ